MSKSFLERPHIAILGSWHHINLAASVSDQIMQLSASATAFGHWPLDRPGRITRVAATFSGMNATPAGTVTFTVYLNGDDPGATYDLTFDPTGAPTTWATTGTLPLGGIVVADGDYITLRVSTDASWNSTGADVSGFLTFEMVT